LLVFFLGLVTVSSAQIDLSPMWQSGDYWKPRTYEQHSTTRYHAVDFYYNSRNRPDIYKNGDLGTAGRPILAPVGGTLFIHLLDVTSLGTGQFPLINAVRVFQGLDPIPQNCFSLVDSLGSTVRVDMSLVIDFASNTRRTIFSHLQINSFYFDSSVQQRIRNVVRKFYNRTAIVPQGGGSMREAVSVGNTVTTVTHIGTISNWGIAIQPHLHFQLFNGPGYSESSPFLGTPQDLSNSSIVALGGQPIFLYEGTYGTDFQYPAMLRRSYTLNAPIVVNAAWDGGTGAKLRNSPGGSEITTLTNGSTGFIIQTTPQYQKLGSNNHLWYNVQFGSDIGWIAAEYIDPTTVIATGLSISSKLVMDSDFIYWAEDDGTVPYYQDDTTGVVRKVGKNGGTVTTLASGLNHPVAVLLDNYFVYFIERGSWPNSNGTIKKVPKNGGTITTLTSGLNYPQGASTIDATNVYFADPCNVKKIGISGGQVTTIATDVCWGPGALAVDGSGSLFYILVSGLTSTFGLKVSVNGGTVTTLASVSTSYNDTVLDTSYVYWTEQGTPPYGYPVPGNGVVQRISKNGGTVTLLASGLNAPTEIVLDHSSSYLYWVNNGAWTNGVYNANTSSIQRISTVDGTITTLAESLNYSSDILVDAFHIYWSETPSAGAGSIKRMPINIVGVAQSTEITKEFVLHQNYPNPFNPTTTLSFSLPSKSYVSLKVFDALGREVSILVSEELPAGTYTLQWSAAGLASGVYFYRLQAGSFTETKKLVLLR